MSTLYQTDKEYQQHNKAIRLIAEQYQTSEPQVREMYENILQNLQADARCKSFLSVLVTRHVKNQLHGIQHQA